MEELKRLLQEQLNENLIKIIISGKKNKEVFADKIKVRPVNMKGNLQFQVTEYVGKKVLHSNLDIEKAVVRILLCLERDFKQCQIENVESDISVLISKRER